MARNPHKIRIGVDTGGTFTDLLCLDECGLRVFKLRSVPEDPSRAILEGIEKLIGAEAFRDDGITLDVTHGSTVATNAVLERKGAVVGLVTTAGFEDLLRIGRQTRPELYNFNVRRSEPLVPSERTVGLQERTCADGSVLIDIDDTELQAAIETLRSLGVESVAVCFLHSYANPAHEGRAATAFRDAGFRTSVSHEILPEYREYERWATTTVNAYVAPLMAQYLERLQCGLGSSKLRIMQSNGGSISAARASTEAVQTILSGPAAGVVGAHAVGAASGYTRFITFDMGGTSTDVSLLDGAVGTTNESLVGDLPVRLPVLDIHTVGAGGGSVAWIDSGGSLRVGPRSAGADPGPVCFGIGEELTVTDANLLLGRLDPTYFLGGRMRLDIPRTQRIAALLASSWGMSVQALAEGIVRIANANMDRAVRVVSVQRGFDPRDFALLAFGGAGGLHACDLAHSLEISTVLIPEHSGVLSALGMLLADVAKDYSASILRPTAHVSTSELREKVAALIQVATKDLTDEGFAQDEMLFIASVAMRYEGQAYEIDVPLTPRFEAMLLVEEDFHARHAKLYGYADPQRRTEAVQLRLRAVGKTAKPRLEKPTCCTILALPSPDFVRETIFAGRKVSMPVFHRGRLNPGVRGEGPAMIVTGESTNIIAPCWDWRIDIEGTLIAERNPARKGFVTDAC